MVDVDSQGVFARNVGVETLVWSSGFQAAITGLATRVVVRDSQERFIESLGGASPPWMAIFFWHKKVYTFGFEKTLAGHMMEGCYLCHCRVGVSAAPKLCCFEWHRKQLFASS